MPKSRNRKKERPNRGKRVQKKVEAVQRLNAFVGNHIKKLESENERMKTDPESVVGQLIPQMREAVAQNKRLSVLAAALIESQGGSVKLTKDALEQFETKVLSIKWELPEGVEKVEDASEFVFTYEALTQEEAAEKAAQFKVTPVNGEQPTTVEVVSAPAEDVPPGHYGRPTEEDEKAINELEAADAVEEAKFEISATVTEDSIS